MREEVNDNFKTISRGYYFRFLLLIFLLIHVNIITKSIDAIKNHWHLFNTTLLSTYLDNDEYKLTDIRQPINENIQLWKKLIKNTLRGAKVYDEYKKEDTLTDLFFNEAIDIIYKHQHPPDCKNVKYLISDGYLSGFGSELHMEGIGLAIAMETNRIFINPKKRSNLLPWKITKSICDPTAKTSNTDDCFFQTYSNCSISTNDIKTFTQNSEYKSIRHLKLNKNDIINFIKNGNIKIEALHQAANNYNLEKYLRFSPYTNLVKSFRTLIPSQLSHLVRLLPIDPTNQYYWYRAISVAYLMRINIETFHNIKSNGIKGIDELNGNCISIYIRHGDKSKEMQLLPFSKYSDVANQLWNMSFYGSNNNKKTIVIGTETQNVLEEAFEWGKNNNWNILYNPMQLELFKPAEKLYNILFSSRVLREITTNSEQQSINNNYKRNRRNKKRTRNNRIKRINGNILSEYSRIDTIAEIDDEILSKQYLLMITNLVDFMKCNAFVCTLASNYCRLLDELRATIGHKPNVLFADISKESCSNPPCFQGSGTNGVLDFGF